MINISFDSIEKEDYEASHKILEDVSFLYTESDRKGLIFKYYQDKDIKEFLTDKNIMEYNKLPGGSKDIILKK